MYAQQMRGFRRICVNPALRLSRLDSILKVGTFDYFQPTASGKRQFTVTPEIIQHFKEMEDHQFDGLDDSDRRLCWGFFATGDDILNTSSRDEFAKWYGGHIREFNGGHRLNNTIMKEVIIPFIRELMEGIHD